MLEKLVWNYSQRKSLTVLLLGNKSYLTTQNFEEEQWIILLFTISKRSKVGAKGKLQLWKFLCTFFKLCSEDASQGHERITLHCCRVQNTKGKVKKHLNPKVSCNFFCDWIDFSNFPLTRPSPHWFELRRGWAWPRSNCRNESSSGPISEHEQRAADLI